MNEKEQKIADDAVRYAKEHKADIIKKFADPTLYKPSSQPISLFMAGSPGAGKTEISKALAQRFKHKPVRIDADEIRDMLPGYMGDNAYLFQTASTKGVHLLFDYCHKRKISIILDGTFAYVDALTNIERALKRGRKAIIYYIYQEPYTAWEFTKARESEEGRRVSKDIFIKSFFFSRENAQKAKDIFKENVELNLIMKNYDNGIEDLSLNIDRIDAHMDSLYTKDELNKKLL